MSLDLSYVRSDETRLCAKNILLVAAATVRPDKNATYHVRMYFYHGQQQVAAARESSSGSSSVNSSGISPESSSDSSSESASEHASTAEWGAVFALLGPGENASSYNASSSYSYNSSDWAEAPSLNSSSGSSNSSSPSTVGDKVHRGRQT